VLDSEPAITRGGARGLAIFASSDADVLEAVRLPSPVEPMAVVDTVPWLEPLAGMISPGDWGAAVVSRSAARLFPGGPSGLTEFAAIHDDLHRRHAQGGLSQARFQRGVEEQVAFHARRVADHLLRAHQHRPFEHLAIVATDKLQPVIVRSLHSTLSERLAGTIDADLEHAPTGEIARAVEPVITRAARDHERELVASVEQALGTGGTTAAGLDEVLSMLEQDRVEALLAPERSTLKADLCPICGRLSTDGGRRCPLDGAVLAEVDATEEAARRSAPIVVVRHGTDWAHTARGNRCGAAVVRANLIP
jgi:peptide chain release factor subunit 1